jgi:hypothetical protein
MFCLLLPCLEKMLSMGETMNLQHGSATWRSRRQKLPRSSTSLINAQEATDLIKILRSLKGKTLSIFRYLAAPWSYDSNQSRIKTIRGSYKQLCPNHRVQHVLKSVLDNTQRWSKTNIAPLFELHFRWMTTRWKGNFINFSIELYFNICSVLDRGEIHEKETARIWWE